jgi:hypothetical protein
MISYAMALPSGFKVTKARGIRPHRVGTAATGWNARLAGRARVDGWLRAEVTRRGTPIPSDSPRWTGGARLMTRAYGVGRLIGVRRLAALDRRRTVDGSISLTGAIVQGVVVRFSSAPLACEPRPREQPGFPGP